MVRSGTQLLRKGVTNFAGFLKKPWDRILSLVSMVDQRGLTGRPLVSVGQPMRDRWNGLGKRETYEI